MGVSAAYIDYVRELFAPFGDISVRRMFGGAGVYCDDLFFAILVDDDLWFKADEASRSMFEAAGCVPFRYDKKDGETAEMGYFSAPGDVFDDEAALLMWTSRALEAARRARAQRKPPKRSGAVRCVDRDDGGTGSERSDASRTPRPARKAVRRKRSV